MDECDPVAEPLEAPPGLVEHRRRAVQGDDATVGEALEEHLGHPAAAAAGVEDAFVALQSLDQPLDDRRAPARLGIGDGVVGPGVPVARRRGHAAEYRPRRGIEEAAPVGHGLDLGLNGSGGLRPACLMTTEWA